MITRDVQRLLTAAGYYNGGIDNDPGPKTLTAVDKVLSRHKPDAAKWSDKRRLIAAAQVILAAAGYEPGTVDGYAGHNTLEAFNAWDHVQTTGKAEQLAGRDYVPTTNAPQPAKAWPRQADVPTFFGPAGSSAATAGTCDLPFAFRIAWNTSQRVNSYKCHRLVADPMTRIWASAAKHYGEKEFRRLGLDLFGGCFNDRAMRGGTKKSMHAYGIATDIDPTRNQLRWGRDRAELAKPAYEPFWKMVEAEGAVSLGRVANFDWMHFQFARL